MKILSKNHPLPSVIAGNALATLSIGVLGFALPVLSANLGVAGKWIGLSFSAYFLAKLCLAPFAGILSDRFGPKRLLIWTTTGGALLPIIQLTGIGFSSMPTIFALLGFVAGAVKPVCLAVIGGEAPVGAQGKYFGWCNIYYFAALILGPIIGGILIDPKNPESILLFVFSCLLLMLFLFIGGMPEIAGHSNPKVEKPDVRPNRRLVMICLMLAIMGRTFGIAVMIAFYPLWLLDRIPYNGALFGLLAAVPNLAACAIIPFGGYIADRGDRLRIALAGMLISAAGLMTIPLCDQVAGCVCAGVVMGIGTGISMPAAMAAASEAGHRSGTRMGFFQGAANLGFMAGPFFGGLVMDFSGIAALFCITGCVGLLTCLPIGIYSLGVFRVFGKKFVRVASAACLAGVLIAFSAFLLVRPQGAGAKEAYRFADTALGSVAHLTLIADNPKTADAAARKAFELIQRLSGDFDHRQPESSVGRMNAAAGKNPAPVSEDAFLLIERALIYSQKSEGVFNIAIGAVTTDPDFLSKSIPHEISTLLDYRAIQLDPSARTVFLPIKGMALDVGGLAKGTIIDRAVDLLKNAGIEAGIVEIGGDFFCFGHRQWRAGIQHPRQEALIGVIAADEQAICGSGDYYQFVLSEKDISKRQHHIIDPHRLESATNSIGVTVIGSSTEQADALATTLFIMGPAKGIAFLNAHYPDAAALWVTPDLQIVKTANFPAFISE